MKIWANSAFPAEHFTFDPCLLSSSSRCASRRGLYIEIDGLEAAASGLADQITARTCAAKRGYNLRSRQGRIPSVRPSDRELAGKRRN